MNIGRRRIRTYLQPANISRMKSASKIKMIKRGQTWMRRRRNSPARVRRVTKLATPQCVNA